ncbi:MAG: multicopper oxidase [Sphaerisporangium sp.]|nr:multicopper oxidase [Sphaerisporangium sp.]
MTVAGLTALDLVAGVAATVVWLGAGATAAARRSGLALALFGVAVAASLARVWLALALVPAGSWFVQEKVTLTLPLLLLAALLAGVLAGPRLISTARGREGASSGPAVVVPLLGAGYAAGAGLVVTLLIGYPATWSTGLITVALVAAAVLVTWRLVSASVPGLRATAAVALTVGLIGVGLAFVPAETTDTGGGPSGAMDTGGASDGDQMHHGQPVTALRGPSTPAAGGTARRFTLTARTATITLSSGRKVAAWTFDGRVPGPPITAAEGDLIEVRLRNADITAGVTLHWHGYDVPSGEDGVPGLTQEAVLPGHEFVYRFRATQVGTYWYHTHEVSDLGVKMGLYGTLVVTPRKATTEGAQQGASEGADLTVPVHTFAGRTVLGDHDEPFQQRVAPGESVRLRLINTDDTPHQFTLSGTPYRLAAIDGRNLNDPGELSRTRLRLPAGGRYDLVLAMPASGAVLRVDDRAGSLRLTPDGSRASGDSGADAPATAGDASAVPVTGEDTSGWPEFDPLTYGKPTATPFSGGSRFDRRFTLVLDRGLAVSGGRPMYAHTVNGYAFPSIPTQLVREGDLVHITVVNRGRETHPWHLHGHTVLVLARDGNAPTGSPVWLDTFDVRPGEVWDVAFRAGNPGMWMNHCHNLSHADLGMALHLAYEGVTTPFHGTHGG